MGVTKEGKERQVRSTEHTLLFARVREDEIGDILVFVTDRLRHLRRKCERKDVERTSGETSMRGERKKSNRRKKELTNERREEERDAFYDEALITVGINYELLITT